MPRQRPSNCLMVNLCARCVSGFPVVFVVGLLLWSYYAYVVVLCGQLIGSLLEKILLGAVFTILWAVLLWSYYKAINTLPGEPPEQFRLSDTQIAEYDALDMEDKTELIDARKELLDRFGADLPLHTRLPSGSLRYCAPCGIIKPDRTHHCSMCKKCVLKMDHHCPWVNNCVGFGNYKFFVLFLLYTTVFCLFTAFSTLPTFIASWGSMGLGHHSSHSRHANTTTPTETPFEFSTTQRLSVIFLFFLSAVFCLSVSFLAIYHLYLTASNMTTLEQGRPAYFSYGKDLRGFDLGHRKNIQQVLGEDVLLWFLPISRSLGSGYEFPLRQKCGTDEGERLLVGEGAVGAMSGEESDHV